MEYEWCQFEVSWNEFLPGCLVVRACKNDLKIFAVFLSRKKNFRIYTFTLSLLAFETHSIRERWTESVLYIYVHICVCV
jgi:hypothetical protein